MLGDPYGWEKHLRRLVKMALFVLLFPNRLDCWRSTAATILTAVYGWPSITDKDDHILKVIHRVAHKLTESLVPGTFLVDTFPILKHAPLWAAKWKRDGLEWFHQQTEIFKSFNSAVEEKMVRSD